MSVDWTGIRMWLLGEVDTTGGINIPTEAEMERLVSLHGWEALGAVIEAVMDEKKLREALHEIEFHASGPDLPGPTGPSGGSGINFMC